MKSVTTKKRGYFDGKKNVMKCRSTICEQKSDLSPKHLRYRGFALVWAALSIFVLFLLVGLSLDIAKLCLVNHQMHNAADAGALAGAPWVKKDQSYARQLAQEFAALNSADHNDVLLDLNESNDPNGDIIIGRYTYIYDHSTGTGEGVFTRYDPTAEDPNFPINALAVIVKRTQEHEDSFNLGGPIGPIALNFGSLVGVDDANLAGNWIGKAGPYAIAIAVGGAGSGIICLRHDLTGLHIQGVSTLTVNNITEPYVYEEGAMWINSSDNKYSLYANGTATVNVDIVNIAADSFTDIGNFEFPPEPETYINYRQPPLPDPLAWVNIEEYKPTNLAIMDDPLGSVYINNLKLIPKDTDPESPTFGDTIPIPSGYYEGGLELDSGTVADPIVLGSGIYVLDGDGLKVGAGATVVCEPGVFFYITGTGECLIAGTADFTAEPMDSGLYEGIIIAQDNEDLKGADIGGGPGFKLKGTMYFPQHVVDQSNAQAKTFALTVRGDGAAFNNQIIADSIYIPGGSNITVNYDGRNPAPVSRAYLVE